MEWWTEEALKKLDVVIAKLAGANETLQRDARPDRAKTRQHGGSTDAGERDPGAGGERHGCQHLRAGITTPESQQLFALYHTISPQRRPSISRILREICQCQ